MPLATDGVREKLEVREFLSSNIDHILRYWYVTVVYATMTWHCFVLSWQNVLSSTEAKSHSGLIRDGTQIWHKSWIRTNLTMLPQLKQCSFGICFAWLRFQCSLFPVIFNCSGSWCILEEPKRESSISGKTRIPRTSLSELLSNSHCKTEYGCDIPKSRKAKNVEKTRFCKIS